ncbi:MAG: hypothetical protein K2M97_08755 [Muribaculaceae bacterium]|nr:hypothetical protein [Muribaculaceae bacterium]
MNCRHIAAIAGTVMLLAAPAASAQGRAVTVHGAVQADVLFPEHDASIGTERYDTPVLGNGYASAGLFSKYVDAGVRVEYMQYPLPGFERDFKGWGLGNIYVKGKIHGVEITAGDLYDQFGSGFILRTYEERSLGIDNSIRGGRVKVDALPGVHFTALGGLQRRYWDWSRHSQVYGADLELDLHQWIKPLERHGIIWTLGGSWVLRHQSDERILTVDTIGSLNKLRLPSEVNAFDVRTQFNKGGLNVLAEFAWKDRDPSFDNNYTYARGTAVMLSASYSRTGWSAQVQAKRSENMAFRSQRSMSGVSAFINNMPAFAYQHTYALAAMYPYATQAAPGEWALQGNFAYTFRRRTAMGGRYGTKLRLNVSYIRGIDRDEPWRTGATDLYGTDGTPTRFFGWGPLYYTDVNLQLDKKITSALTVNAMYMYQRYNKTVIEGEGGMVNAHIAVGELKYRFSPRYTLRAELQYLATAQDKGDWAYGLLELSVNPWLMASVSDQWNLGSTDKHYYMVSLTGNYKSNRLMIGYGLTRAGYNCSGGVCRYVPASRGFQLSYNYNF